jgi:hypothetical protein
VLLGDEARARRLARSRRWKAGNADQVREVQKAYQTTRRKVDPDYALRHALRTRLNQAIKAEYKSGSAVRDLGCTIAEFRAYIEALFSPGMSWANWGEWHLDHKRDLAFFDLTDRAQFLDACHFTNYQPLWAADNLSKRTNLGRGKVGLSRTAVKSAQGVPYVGTARRD